MKPLLAVLAVLGAGLVLVLFNHWRLGSGVLGLGLGLAAGLRLLLPSARAGDLVVRSRGVDAAVLGTLSLALLVLANTIPRGR